MISEILKEKWTERAAQDVIYIRCAIKNHEIIVPNSCVFNWEADLISVTSSGFVHEFEVKISRADFKADAKKERAGRLVNPTVQGWFRTYEVERPNYFHYVVPENLISVDEIPDYAGLIYLKKPADGHRLYYGLTEVIKEAKRLHGNKISERARRQLARAMTLRFWRQRLNGADKPSPREECY